MAVTVQRAHSGNTGKGFSTVHKHTHVTQMDTHKKHTKKDMHTDQVEPTFFVVRL